MRGRVAQPQPVAEIPGGTSPRPLTRPIILFAVIRAAALAIAVAISFGLKLPNAYWMPMATIIAMKPSLQRSALIAEQRIAGTVVGAAVAALVLLAVDNRTALEVIVVVLVALGASIHGVNYAWYTAALAGAILIAADVPHPADLADQGRRILFTFAGVGSPSSSCSWRTCCKSTAPPNQLHTHLPRAGQVEPSVRHDRIALSGPAAPEAEAAGLPAVDRRPRSFRPRATSAPEGGTAWPGATIGLGDGPAQPPRDGAWPLYPPPVGSALDGRPRVVIPDPGLCGIID